MNIPPGLEGTFATSNTDGRAGGARWREISRILYAYYRRDMSDAADEQRRLYPDNWDKHVPRTVPFVYRVSRELASLYLRAPYRRWLRKRTDASRGYAEGDLLPEATTRAIDRVYRGADVNGALQHANEVMVATGNAPILVWPLPTVGGVRLIMPPPHECDVQLRDSLSSGELDVVTFWCRLPLARDPITDMLIYGVAEITETTAKWVSGPEDMVGRGLWNDEGTNPLGEVPLVMIRRAAPAPGEFWASAPEDLLDAQRALSHDFTDLGTIARLQGFAQGYVKGMNQEQVNQLEIGPNTFAGLWGDDAEIGFASPKPDLNGYKNQMESYVRAVTGANGLNPATLMKSSGITAVAKQVELADREVERRRFALTFERAEGRIYRLISMWVNDLRSLPNLFPPARVRVEYRESYIPADPLHEVQAAQVRCALGISSPILEIARLEGLTYDEARDRFERNLRDTALLGSSVPALERVAEVRASVQEDAA